MLTFGCIALSMVVQSSRQAAPTESLSANPLPPSARPGRLSHTLPAGRARAPPRPPLPRPANHIEHF